MARASIWQKKFDRDAEYVVARGFTLAGIALRPGDDVDKSKVSTRTLRCLFEQRKITVAGSIPARAPAERKVAHVGRGKFCVMQGKVRLSEPAMKEEAEAILIEMNKPADAA